MPTPLLPRRLLITVGTLATVVAATGCSASPLPAGPTGGLAVVVGARANMPAPELSGVGSQVVVNAVTTRAEVSVVVADGAPFVVKEPALAGLVEDDRGAGERRVLIQDALGGAAARTPETDLLAGLALAAEQVADAPGQRTVLVVDSGLSTTGTLDFRQKGLLDADPDDLANSLEQAHALPDLSGIHVVFQGLGDTAHPQAALSAVAREHLIDLWTAIALRAGALDVNIERTALTGDAPGGLPPVGVVGSSGGGVTCEQNSVVLTGGDVAFEADSAVFEDLVAASETLQPIARSMSGAAVRATLTGTTARVGDPAGQRRLSEQRAQAVADLLTDLGVPASRLTVRGLGSQFPGYVRDHDSEGSLLPAQAAQNRRVVIELSGSARPAVCR